jgi:membrane protease YdiL (CAAX protease family)
MSDKAAPRFGLAAGQLGLAALPAQSQPILVEQKLARPGFWMAALWVVLILFIQVVLAVPLGIIDVVYEQVLHRPSPQLERQPFVIGCINLVAFGVPIALGVYLNRLTLRRAFPIGQVTIRQVACVAGSVLGASVLLSEVDNVFRSILPPPQWLVKVFQDLFSAQNKLFSRVLLLVIIAPVTEELFFRGIVLRGLLSRHRPAVAVTLTAVLFAGLHLNPWQFLSALFLGILFGWLYLRTGSVPLCMLAHATANGLSIVSTLIRLEIPGLTGTPGFGQVVFQPWWLDLSGLVVLLAGVWGFLRSTPQSEATEQ